MNQITDDDKMRCAAREVRQRRRVYPRLISSGTMTQQQADREIRTMEAIMRDYEARLTLPGLVSS